jgi:hypothetical protein
MLTSYVGLFNFVCVLQTGKAALGDTTCAQPANPGHSMQTKSKILALLILNESGKKRSGSNFNIQNSASLYLTLQLPTDE